MKLLPINPWGSAYEGMCDYTGETYNIGSFNYPNVRIFSTIATTSEVLVTFIGCTVCNVRSAY